MNYKFTNSGSMKRWRAETVGRGFNSKGIYLFTMLILMMVVALQSLHTRVQAKELYRVKRALSLMQGPSSLLEPRHKRDTFATQQEGIEVSDEDNYDVLPDMNSQPSTLEDRISEKAKQIAESFSNMWQSLTDSIRHCVDALRSMFSDDVDGQDLTPEQEQQLREYIEAQYRLKQEQDNEVF